MARSPRPGSRPSPALTLAKLVGVLSVAGVLSAGLLMPYVGGIGLVARHEGAQFLDQPCNLTETPPPLRTTLYANDGQTILASIFKQDRQPVPLTQVPKVLQQALVATEDRRFFSHQGVDMRGLVRSALNTSSGDTQGGSTLTMQYVKQERYYQATDDPAAQAAAVAQTIERKIEDAKCAIKIEKAETKNQILENYLNIAFFGENSYSVQTAAQNFFGREVKDLTLAQSALLVGVLKAPTDYDPFLHKKASLNRRNQVIDNLLDQGNISAAEADKAKSDPGNLATTEAPTVQEGCSNANKDVKNAGFFCDYVVNEWLLDPQKGGLTDKQLKEGGLSIVTTLDANVQNTVQSQVSASMPATSPMTEIMPVINPKSGDVLAMATSKIYGNKSSPRDVTHTTLPVFTNDTTGGASTYKYFTMLAALQAGAKPDFRLGANVENYTAYKTSFCSQGSYVSHNSEAGDYQPNETLQSAIAKSSNTYFVALQDQFFNKCSLRPIVDLARTLGMDSLDDRISSTSKTTVGDATVNDQRAVFSLGQDPTNPLELAGAYGAVANDGEFARPAPIISIKDHTGKDIPFHRSAPKRVVSPQIARTAVQLLIGDTNSGDGTSHAVFAPYYGAGGSPVAGKTGTNNAVFETGPNRGKDNGQSSSVWFVGVTPDFVATTAVINLDHASRTMSGLPNIPDSQAAQVYGSYAAQLWLNALTPALQGRSWSWQDPGTVPDGIQVPPVIGQPVPQATATLQGLGFKVALVDNGQPFCASSQPFAAVGYQQPDVAAPGDTVTLCLSNDIPPTVYTPPPPPPAAPRSTRPTRPTPPTLPPPPPRRGRR